MIETYRELTVWRLCNWISTSWIQNINSDFTASTHINGQLSVSHLKTHDQYRWCKNIEASTQSFFGTTVAENRLRSIASMILKSNVESNCPTRFFSDGGSYPKWHKRTCHQAQPFKQFPWSTSHEQSNPTIFHRISQTMYPKKSLKSLSICCFAIAWLSNMFLSKCKSWNTIFFPDEVGWLYFLLFSNFQNFRLLDSLGDFWAWMIFCLKSTFSGQSLPFFKVRSLGLLVLLDWFPWVFWQRRNRFVSLFFSKHEESTQRAFSKKDKLEEACLAKITSCELKVGQLAFSVTIYVTGSFVHLCPISGVLKKQPNDFCFSTWTQLCNLLSLSD